MEINPNAQQDWVEWRAGKADFRAKFHALANEIEAHAIAGKNEYEFKIGLSQRYPMLTDRNIAATVAQVFFREYPEYSIVTTKLEHCYVTPEELEAQAFPPTIP